MAVKVRSVKEIRSILENYRKSWLKYGVGFVVVGIVGVVLVLFADDDGIGLFIWEGGVVWLLGVLLVLTGVVISIFSFVFYCVSDGYPYDLSTSDRVVFCVAGLSEELQEYTLSEVGRKLHRKSVRKWLKRLNYVSRYWGIGGLRWLKKRLDWHTDELRSSMEMIGEFTERLNYYVKGRLLFPESRRLRGWIGSRGWADGDFMDEGMRLANEDLGKIEDVKDGAFSIVERIRHEGVKRVIRVVKDEQRVSFIGFLIILILAVVCVIAVCVVFGVEQQQIVVLVVMVVVAFVAQYLRHAL